MPRQRDLLRIVDAAYELGPDASAWTRRIVEAARPLLDHGLGVLCQVFDPGPPPCTAALAVAAGSPALDDCLRQLAARTERRPELLLGPHLGPGLHWLSEVAPPDDPYVCALAQASEPLGATDLAFVCARDGGGQAILLASLVGRSRRALGRASTWEMIASHLAAGLRVQHVGAGLAAGFLAGAPFDGSGWTGREEGLAKAPRSLEQIRTAVRRIDRIQGHDEPGDSALGLTAWKGLIEGTWSLIDRHDHDGRRFVVAVPNPPGVRCPRGLSPNEARVAALAALGQSDKLIAYALGLSRSTVATHLSRALRKLGFDSRVALARVFAALHEEADQRP
jgi:DNA-binding CsgD family transcriptional regulator